MSPSHSSPPVNDTGSKTGRNRLYYGWVMLVLCMIFIAVTYGIRLSFGIFFGPLEQDFNWTRTETSMVFSIYMIMGSLFAVVGGWVADRRGPRAVFLVMGILAFAGLALSSLAASFWHLLLSYSLVLAMGTGATYPVSTSIASRWFKERRTLALAIATAGVGLGSIILAPVVSYLIQTYGWRLAFLALGIIAVVITVPCSLLLKKNPPGTAMADGKIKPAAGTAGNSGTGNVSPELTLRQAVKTRSFFILAILWFFYAYCLFMIMTHIVRHATDLGIDALQAAAILSITGFANIPSRLVMGYLSDKYGRKPVAMFCGFMMLASMVWLVQSSSLWMLYVFAAVFGAAYGGLGPPTAAMVGDIFGLRNLGIIFGFLEVGWVCGAAVGPAVTGYIFDTTGQYHWAFWLGAFASAMIIILVRMIRLPASGPAGR